MNDEYAKLEHALTAMQQHAEEQGAKLMWKITCITGVPNADVFELRVGFTFYPVGLAGLANLATVEAEGETCNSIISGLAEKLEMLRAKLPILIGPDV